MKATNEKLEDHGSPGSKKERKEENASYNPLPEKDIKPPVKPPPPPPPASKPVSEEKKPN